MSEGLDKKLQEEWNKKLANSGLPEIVEREKIPVPPAPLPSAKEILTTLFPGVEESLEKFSTLPDKLQSDILAYLKHQREIKIPPKEILERFNALTAKGMELDKMTTADSDEKYKPELDQGELTDEKREAIERVDRLIRNIEEKIEEAEREKERKRKDEIIN